MSVTEQPRRIVVSLSSADFVHLRKRLLADESFESYGDGLIVEIQRDRPYWIKKEVEDGQECRTQSAECRVQNGESGRLARGHDPAGGHPGGDREPDAGAA
jgi:hypothetical protein